MTTVLITDAQPMQRFGFRMLLESQDDMTVLGEAPNGAEAVRLSSQLRPDVVLMDIRMPGLDGIEATRRIVAAGDRTKVLIMTTFDLDEYAYAGLRAGASGFLGQGWTNTEIAERLHLAESTVKTHVSRILAKTGARDRVQAVILAYDAKLVRPA
ncbi:response regulator transcription factor [Streptomyces sp. ISL-99]|uniref:response regulator transcription factor n=1 Tax=Streptomyces sp. ISL-99 TaxID=2819193 RepID=UPI001BEBDE43|nr:response regulator transcription factor [Streptomyces sp. ISL-99]MBT2526099.1 response regulator transcription factor [Streptomyces sp. ISL-99]